jgi:diaminobutyrate-2-oxoglutarate transaminase
MKRALIDYIERDGVMHSLDMATRARHMFLDRFSEVILTPRGLDYRVQFTGPTGTNAVEAALKLARKVTRRSNVIAFTRAYHGLSLGSLAVTANSYYRDAAFGGRGDVAFMPYDGYLGKNIDTLAVLRLALEDRSSGIDLPAAIIVETIQAEGGINIASLPWLRGLAALCQEFDILLIVDDIQVGCGRTGTFFSFEEAGIDPDIVVLSKAISGFGLPMALNLIKPAIDQWKPGEHSGTFRGNGASFITAASALRFWKDPAFPRRLRATHEFLAAGLQNLKECFPSLPMAIRGKGMIFGVDISTPDVNRQIARECFARGLLIETCGAERGTLKLLPPLTASDAELSEALEILRSGIEAAVLPALIRNASA